MLGSAQLTWCWDHSCHSEAILSVHWGTKPGCYQHVPERQEGHSASHPHPSNGLSGPQNQWPSASHHHSESLCLDPNWRGNESWREYLVLFDRLISFIPCLYSMVEFIMTANRVFPGGPPSKQQTDPDLLSFICPHTTSLFLATDATLTKHSSLQSFLLFPKV